jgi:hypothetical protein
VALAHFLETTPSNFLLGAAIVLLLTRGRSTKPVA